MNKKMNNLDKLKLWYHMNNKTIGVVLLFVVFFLSVIGFSNFGKTIEEPQQDISMYSESTEVITADYEKIFGYAPMDSAVPPLKGIKVKYTYQVNHQTLTGKQTFYLRGFKKMMNGINKTPESLEIR